MVLVYIKVGMAINLMATYFTFNYMVVFSLDVDYER